MLTPQEFDQILDQIEYDRASAQSDDLAVLEDKVWTKFTVASRHALLVRRFEALSAAERNYAMRLASEPGRMMEAEQSRVRATELYDIAVRHKAAAEQIYEDGAKLREEAEPLLDKQRQHNDEQPQANNRRRMPRPGQPQPATAEPQPRAVPRRPPEAGPGGSTP